MAYLIDNLVNSTAYIIDKDESGVSGRWVIARPLPGTFLDRLRDAWLVLRGKADAVRFYGQ